MCGLLVNAFEKIMFVATSHVVLSMPIVSSPNFQKKFVFMVDIRHQWYMYVSAVLMQCDSEGMEHPA